MPGHLISLLVAAGALFLVSCVSDPPPPYAGPGPNGASIWERPPVYGMETPAPQQQRPNANRYNTPPQTYPSGGNRYGAAPQPTPQSAPQQQRSQQAPVYNQQYQPGAPARLSGTVPTAPTPQPGPPIGQPPQTAPTQTPQPGPPAPAPGGALAGTTGNNPAMTPAPSPTSAPEPTPPSPAPTPPTETTPPPASEEPEMANEEPVDAGDFNNLPFAVPVPGKSGYVTLPGPDANLPEIDVRGIAPGTPVEIPNPNDPDSTIQFRVP